MRLTQKKYTKRELKDVTEETITLTFERGKEKITKQIDFDDYDMNDWPDFAMFEIAEITPSDVNESTIKPRKRTRATTLT